ncbi:hypothetical protein NQ318_008643 [Aromia moschata]|uniref:Lectin n=1 Tax=Aromia moschata TaxID=1265417 RepID=A0AAV8YW48_9CUCU|nr:hypothetical protein NQ318_008643 [Aromia moschata]
MAHQVLLAFTVLVLFNVAFGGDEGQYQIVDGNCSTAFVSDIVFHDHVHKTRLPLVGRDAKSSWHGDKKIYCLKVLNEKDSSKGGRTSVQEGGVGHSFVTVEMHSPKNHGLEFTIQVYAR